jgi:hypothetical protein
MIASRTTSHLSRSPKPRTFHDITLASPVIFSSEMLHIGRPTRVLFFRTGGMPVKHLQGEKDVGPHISLIPSPHSTTRGRTASAPRLYHARTHDECSPPREGMAAAPDAPPLPRPEGRPAGWMRRRSSRLPRMMLLLLPAASGGRARRAEDLKRRATGGRALASRGWRTGKHVARGGAAPAISSTSFLD